MHPRPIYSATLAAILCGCASNPSTNTQAVHDATAIAMENATLARWTGSFQPTQSRTGDAMITERQRAYGTIELLVSRDRPERTRVRLSVSTPLTSAISTLRWGIYPGSCGSGAPPVIPAEAFPVIELTNNGRGSIDQEFAFEMPADKLLHANVLQGSGTQLSNVLTCANLRRAK